MDHADHVRLLAKGVHVGRDTSTADVSVVWADLGAGEGAFTLALGDLLPSGSTIQAIDRDAEALETLAARYARRFGRRDGAPRLITRVGNFRDDLGLTDLDGVVMANSLHFSKDKPPVLARVRGMLRRGAPLLLVEYDVDRGNALFPYPLSFETWRTLAVANGFTEPVLLDSEPSRFMNRIYSSVAARSD